MSFLNYIPGVAHVKALTHLICNDKEGAERTMETFHTKTPIVSHLAAGIAKVAGDDKLAKKCWEGGNSSLNALPVVGHAKGLGHYLFLDIEGGNKAMVDATSTTLNMADGIPGVGHTKGLVHYACGDVEGGNKAMKAATRTTAVMTGGAGGFLVGGPVGAVAGGVSVGAEWDLVTAAVTDGKEVNGIAKIILNPKNVDSYFDAGLSVFGDGLAGYSGGKMAEKMVGPSETAVGGKADPTSGGGDAGSAVPSEKATAAALDLAEDYRTGKITYTEYQQKWNDMKPQVGLGDKVVQQAYKDLTEGKISKAEYFEIKYKSVSNNVPVSAGEANAGQAMKVTQYPVANSSGNQTPANSSGNQTPANSSGNQTPANSKNNQPPANSSGNQTPANSKNNQPPANNGNQPPEQPNGNNNGPISDRVRVLRERLATLLEWVAERFMLDQENLEKFIARLNLEENILDYEREPWGFRKWQRKIFYWIYKTISELFSHGHIARFDSETLRLVISSNFDSWSEQIDHHMAGQLDVNDQLIDHQQFPLDRDSSCPTILTAQFGPGWRLVLSSQEIQCGVIRVIYAFCCRLCVQNDPFEFNPGNNNYINYVGQSVQSVHMRVCGKHGVAMKNAIINMIANRNVNELPKYKHGANHFCNNHLPQEAQGTQPRDAFRELINIILLPISSDGDLSSWESFWQFFCLCRTAFGGWSLRGPRHSRRPCRPLKPRRPLKSRRPRGQRHPRGNI